MSYDISFRVKVEDIDYWLPVGFQNANITYNVREIIRKSTGLRWLNEENNGLVKYIIPCIQRGRDELMKNRNKYKPYESPNGWGTVNGTISFFSQILEDWEAFQQDYPELVDVVTFWIV